MAITLHGSSQSTCSQRVLTTLLELGIPYTLRTVDFAAGEHKSEAFLKLQPFGKVPVLEDDGFIVYESRAICKYLVAKYGKPGTALLPDTKDSQAYGLFEQACSIEHFYFNPAAEGLTYEKLFKAYHGGGAADEVLVAKFVAQLDSTLKEYEGILSKQKYVAGNEFSLADVYHLPYGKKVVDLGYNGMFEKYPNVWAWWQRSSERESWKKVVAG